MATKSLQKLFESDPVKESTKKEALCNIKMNTINIENISNACIKGSHSWRLSDAEDAWDT